MAHDHLDSDMLERILAVDRTEDQNRCLLHQIALCPECRAVGGYLLDLHQSGALSLRFGPVDVALARSRADAPALYAKLARHSAERRHALVRATRSFASLGLCELLCRESEKAAADDPAQAAELGELAVLVADSIEKDSVFEDRWIYQLRALAWAHLGNARRVKNDLEQAEQAFAMSESWWAVGEEDIGDALGYEPVVMDLRATLRSDQHRGPEALELLDRAFACYLEGDPGQQRRSLARVLIKKSYVFMEMLEPAKAIAVLQEAGGLLEAEAPSRLFCCVLHNLADNLATIGRFAEARALLPEVKALSESVGGRIDRIRLQWVEARISAGLGELDKARQALIEVRREFSERQMAYDVSLVSQDLASVL